MTKKMVRLVSVAGMMLGLAACSTRPMDMDTKVSDPSVWKDGYVAVVHAESTNPTGIDIATSATALCIHKGDNVEVKGAANATIVQYEKDGGDTKCVANIFQGMDGGIVKTALPSALGAAGQIGFGAVLRQPNYNSSLNISNEGSTALSGSQSAGGTSVSESAAGASSASNANANVSGTQPCTSCSKSSW